MSSPVIPASLERLFSSPPGPCCVPSLPETPKSSKTRVKKFRRDSAAAPAATTPHRHHHEKPHSPSSNNSKKSCFASGSFTDSPSARCIPPPPTTWVVEDFSSDTSGCESDSNFSSSSSDSCSLRDDLMKSPTFGEMMKEPSSPGIRVTPMQLIAAVVSA